MNQEKLEKRIKVHKVELKRLNSIVDDEKKVMYIRIACEHKAKQLRNAIKILNNKLVRL